MSRSGGRAPSQRQLRVGEELRHGLARVLAQGEFADPELAGVSITVTEVRVSPDLKQATAFVVPLGGETLVPTVKALNRAAGFVRGQLAQEIVLKSVPRVVFKADRSFDEADRLNRLFAAPRVRHDIEPGSSDDPPAAGPVGDGDPVDGA